MKLRLYSLIAFSMFGCSTVTVQENVSSMESSNGNSPAVFHSNPVSEVSVDRSTSEQVNQKNISVVLPAQQSPQKQDQTELSNDASQWPVETGMATYYAMEMEGRLTASGEPYSPELLTAAHRTLPLGSTVRITNLENNQQVVVRINDRWGGGSGRVINLSKQAAVDLGFGSSGMVSVRLDVESLSSQKAVQPASIAQPLPARIEVSDPKNHSKLSVCQNEADILGLTGDFYKNHIAACMMRGN
ncbi:MAG: septal ring lytic transglycosylase RlpA family protein [Pseudomonadota bacterium]